MWITVLVMAVAVSLEPFRIGMTVLMLNRPRPILQLLAFLSGGFAMAMTVGLIVLFVFRRRLPGSSPQTLPKVQIVIGVLALLVAAVLVIKVLMGRLSRGCPAKPPFGGSVTTVAGKLSARARRLLDRRSLWVAGVAGLGIALPSVDYLAALAVILASGAAAVAQAGALLMFNIVAFALVEIPLAGYLLAPQPTRTSMAALHEWIRSRRGIEVATLLAAVGCVLLTAGIAGL
jgi:Sap, sulfolipid-1-addressing protein